MFERYTEKARRTIFFARYEASQCGSPYIESEHFLLGLLREAREIVKHLRLDKTQLDERLRNVSPPKSATSTSVDLPFSNECKRILAYAAEEAERMSHQHIGTEHLLLGIVREENCAAAMVLREMSAPSLDQLRESIRSSAPFEAGQLAHLREGGGVKVKFIDEATGKEFASRGLRFNGVPRIGECVVIAIGSPQSYRVRDVEWNLQGASPEDEVQLSEVRVRIRAEHAQDS